jgi:hypothetical protein
MRIMVAAAGLVSVAALATAAPAAAQELPDGVTQAMIAQGDTIFHGAGLCFAFHGAEAKGLARQASRRSIVMRGLSRRSYQRLFIEDARA